MIYLMLKTLLSGLTIAVITELAKRNNTVASVVHSLPLMSLIAFIWLYAETRDAALIGRHAYGTFWFVLPTLPMFLLMPWLIKKLGGFWPGMGAGIMLTIALYWLTMRLLKIAGVNL